MEGKRTSEHWVGICHGSQHGVYKYLLSASASASVERKEADLACRIGVQLVV